MANTKIFKQYDSRYASLPYPNSSSPVSTDGCGLVSVTHCIIENQKYANYTPRDVLPVMKQYAVAGKGTRYMNPDGIAAGLKYYGMKDVRVIDNMADFWEELDKGERVGIILFDSGNGPDGTRWTSARHFIAFNRYEHSGGKHWLYMKDSGGRDHDGWYTYEGSMRGCLFLMWTARIPRNGWRKYGAWYFYKDDTLVKNGWAQDSKKKWFYLGSNGKMVTSSWIFWKNEWYYLGATGEMRTNDWAKDSKGWCYVGSDGKIVKSTWIKYKDEWYWLMDNGYMAEESWVRWKGAWYYLKKGGVMAAAETLVIQGKSYTFAENGKMK